MMMIQQPNKFLNVRVLNLDDVQGSSLTDIHISGTIMYGTNIKNIARFDGFLNLGSENLYNAIRNYVISYVVAQYDLDMQAAALPSNATFRVYVSSFSIPELVAYPDGSLFLLTGNIDKNTTFGRLDVTNVAQQAVSYHVVQ